MDFPPPEVRRITLDEFSERLSPDPKRTTSRPSPLEASMLVRLPRYLPRLALAVSLAAPLVFVNDLVAQQPAQPAPVEQAPPADPPPADPPPAAPQPDAQPAPQPAEQPAQPAAPQPADP